MSKVYQKISNALGLQNENEWLSRDQIFAIIIGQLVSFLIAGTGLCSQLLATRHAVNIPTTQSSFNYLCLAVVYSMLMIKSGRFVSTITSFDKIKVYLPLALIDVEANFMIVTSFQYTNITSVTLLDCFTIPCVVVLTYFFLKTRYNLRHGIGVVLCLVGLVVLVYSDLDHLDGGPNKILGDMLVIGGAMLYAISNVGAEAFFKKFDRIEYLSMIGTFAFIISAIQVAILERDAISSLSWNTNVVSLLAAFTSCLFLFYSALPIALVLGGSALCNLSLLMSDVYAILISIFVFSTPLGGLFYVAFGLIIMGLLCYNVKNEPKTGKESFEVVREEGREEEGELGVSEEEGKVVGKLSKDETKV